MGSIFAFERCSDITPVIIHSILDFLHIFPTPESIFHVPMEMRRKKSQVKPRSRNAHRIAVGDQPTEMLTPELRAGRSKLWLQQVNQEMQKKLKGGWLRHPSLQLLQVKERSSFERFVAGASRT